jgi:branched-chain amino acid transport system permease protein
MALWVFFRYSRIGLAMRAAAEDQEAALAQGIDVRRTVAWSWAISGGLAVAAAIFLGAFPRQVGLEMGFVALAALPAVIIGGFDSLAGAVIGGGVVGLVQIYSADYLADVAGGNVQTVAPYIVMMAVLAIRPTGLFGSPDVDRV